MDYLNVTAAMVSIFNFAFLIVSVAYGIPIAPEIFVLLTVTLAFTIIEFPSYSASIYRLINKGFHRERN